MDNTSQPHDDTDNSLVSTSSSSLSSSTSTSSLSSSTTLNSENSDTGSNGCEIKLIQKLKKVINNIKNSSLSNSQTSSEMVLHINRLCEIDIQLTEIICNLKDLIILLNDLLNNDN